MNNLTTNQTLFIKHLSCTNCNTKWFAELKWHFFLFGDTWEQKLTIVFIHFNIKGSLLFFSHDSSRKLCNMISVEENLKVKLQAKSHMRKNRNRCSKTPSQYFLTLQFVYSLLSKLIKRKRSFFRCLQASLNKTKELVIKVGNFKRLK